MNYLERNEFEPLMHLL